MSACICVRRVSQKQKIDQDECYNALFLTHPEDDREGICSRNGYPVPDTCKWIQKVKEFQIFEQSWIPNSNNFLWMYGGPGKGKTYLSIYLASRWVSLVDSREPRHLVLEYYCDSSNSQRNSALSVLRSLICQLLKANNDLYQDILGEFDSCRRQNQKLASNFYRENLWRIFKSMIKHIPENIVLILDGLDECDDDSISFLQAKLEDLHVSNRGNDQGIKTIIISRPLQNNIRTDLRIDLDDLDKEYSERRIEDIKAFISENVDRISYIDDKNKNHLKETLLRRADGTFLWVSLAINELKNNTAMLEQVIRRPESANTWLPRGLDDMYNRILMNIPESRRQISFKIIQCIYIAIRPLTRAEICLMVDSDDIKVQTSLGSLKHIIVKAKLNKRFQFIHLSLKDHLRSIPPLPSFFSSTGGLNKLLLSMDLVLSRIYLESACDLALLILPAAIILYWTKSLLIYASFFTTAIFSYHRICTSSFSGPLFLIKHFQKHLKIRAFGFKEQKAHEELFKRCLIIMEKLRANGCDMEPGTRITEIDEEKKAKYLLDVEYSCCHWMNHLYKSNSKQGDDGLLHIFLIKHFLHWLEVMSLTKQTPESIIVMNDLKSYTSHVENSELYRFIHDAEQFISFNRSGIEQAPLQIYSSALFFAPNKNIIRQTFKRCIPPWLYEITRKRSNWTPGIQILEGHADFIHHIAFSPNGNMVASCSFDSQIRLYDAASGRLLQLYHHPRDSWNFEATFSPDSRIIASSSKDGGIRIWDTVTGELLHVFRGHLGGATSIVFSLDGKTITSCSYDHTVRLWTMNTDHPSQLLYGSEHHSTKVRSVLVSPDNKMIASLMENGDIDLLNMEGKLLHSFGNNAENIIRYQQSITFSPNSKLIAWIDGVQIKVWGAEVGYELLWMHEYHQPLVKPVFSPNSQMIALVFISSVQLWNTREGVLLQTFNGHFSDVMDVSFSPNGQMIASASQDRTIRLSYISGELVQILKGHLSGVSEILFSPDSKMIASRSFDRSVRLWDIKTLIDISLPKIDGNPIKGSVNWLKFSSDGRMLAINSLFSHQVRLQDVATGEFRPKLVGAWLDYETRLPIQFSPNNKIIATKVRDCHIIQLWDAAKGKLLHELNSNGENISWIIFSHDSTMMLWSDIDEFESKLWSSKTGKLLQKLPSFVNRKHWHSAAFSPDGKVLAFGFDHETQLWSTRTGKLLQKMENHPSSMSSQGRFSRLPPVKRSYKLGHSNDWIVEKTFNRERNILWLPFEYRPSCMASRRCIIAMGYRSGKTFRMKIKNDDNETFAKDIGVWGGEVDVDEDEDQDDEELGDLSDQVRDRIVHEYCAIVMGKYEDSTEDPCVWEGAIESGAES
ncbi:hypothetical protein BofuT4_P091680.1 [Botrytis cinerea T4]|uniref:Nephrocystin 3-like N-terminal domain-containing protein n=1 Tax=Botryotinia fuckeliana (strain T4) TaxID=999810 RepID=G2YEL1_BOTF4|nr:hypothetical protein BofuT4_P091680.1 [Botrytis cinerea T4]